MDSKNTLFSGRNYLTLYIGDIFTFERLGYMVLLNSCFGGKTFMIALHIFPFDLQNPLGCPTQYPLFYVLLIIDPIYLETS